MRILDFRFNGLTIEPVIEFNSSEKAGCQPLMVNIKNLDEARRLREALDVGIQSMEEKEKQAEWDRIITLEDEIDTRSVALDAERVKLAEMRKTYAARHYSPLAAEQT